MKKRIVVLISAMFASVSFGQLTAQSTQPYSLSERDQVGMEVTAQGLDTMRVYQLPPVYTFAKKKQKREYDRLVKKVKKVYPYAKDAQAYMTKLETEYANLKSAREREKFTARMEKEIIKKYTPVLKQMTPSEGRILIKLIDRETNMTSYDILREFRGRFTAGLWNGIAKLFKANLKEGYDRDGEDAMIEHIVQMLEAGAL